jgi:hypothetical protein
MSEIWASTSAAAAPRNMVSDLVRPG